MELSWYVSLDFGIMLFQERQLINKIQDYLDNGTGFEVECIIVKNVSAITM